MPLRDHFRPPLSTRHSWEAFHAGWAFVIAQRLNGSVLSDRFLSESTLHHGALVEIDVATYEDEGRTPFDTHTGNGAVATAAQTYAPPAPSLTGPVAFTDPDLFEVRVYRQAGGWKLVAAVELVSPANKDRPDHRRGFATKAASYLRQGVSVVTVDVVTDRAADMHAELAVLLDLPGSFAWAADTGLSAVSYRVVRANGQDRLDVWPHALELGAALPTMPLWLDPSLAVPLELDLTYTTTCDSLRIR